MKSNIKKRILAVVLCMVLMLSTSISTMADGEPVTGKPVPENGASQEPAETSNDEEKPETDGSEQGQQENSELKEEQQDTNVLEQEQQKAEDNDLENNTQTETDTVLNDSDSEVPELEKEEEKLEWSQEVDSSIVKVTADENVLPSDAVLYASKIESETEIEEIEKAVEEKAIEQQKAVEGIVAYDISFKDAEGNDIQPVGQVNVEVLNPELPQEKNDESKIAVMHVSDDKNSVTEMETNEMNDGIEFTTTHFSTYVIIQQGGNEVNIVLEHYNSSTGEKIYSDDILTLPVGGKVNNYAKANNWEVEKVSINGKDYSNEKDYSEIQVASNSTIKIYYTPIEDVYEGETTFYDYTMKAGTSGKGNNIKYYSINMPENYGSDSASNNKLTVGTTKLNYNTYSYDCWVNGKNANAYTKSDEVIKGLLSGINEKGDVVFNYPEPGFFNNSDASFTVKGQTRYTRKVYKDYNLEFTQKGDTYQLSKVKDGSGKTVAYAGNNFFPLDDVKPSYSLDKDNLKDPKNNAYFGMRYDVTFKIGDYIGPLNYNFTGDDDLWVVLDGDQVVIDLGGIHDAAKGSVDLWDYIGDPSSLSTEEKEKEHKLTVLYMERGAYESNCKMDFTLPSAQVTKVTQTPMADLLLHKVNKQGEALEGARFTLTNQESGEVQTSTSTATGSVQFTKLIEGTYVLTEDMAPSGYIPSLESWIVKVEPKDKDTVVATMYLSDGVTKYTEKDGGYYEILNVTKQELIDSSMDYNKTATVKNWDDRTYDINITASSKLTTTTTEEKTVISDTVIVLDASGSMNYEQTGSSASNASIKSVGKYKEVQLDTTKVYFYFTQDYRPMAYINGKWQWCNSSGRWSEPNGEGYVYQWESRLTGVKEAMNAFVNSVLTSSPKSKLGIASYNTTGKTINLLQEVETNATAMIQNIIKMQATGGTNPEEGLKIAYDQLVSAIEKGDDTPKNVILFTDGAPTGGNAVSGGTDNSWSKSAVKNTKEYSDKIKALGITLYTVGFGLTDKAKGWLDGSRAITYDNINYSGIASKDCALTAENMDELKNIFKKIQSTITESVEIKNAEIKDVIDPRFVILDDEGNPITKDYKGINNGITLKNGGTVYYDAKTGYQYIVWTEQTIPNKEKGEWSNTITVKAQDDYIGGNNVTTNISPDSRISTGYGNAILPLPSVNVKAEIEVGNNEVTIYKGDSIPTDDIILNKLFNIADLLSKYNGITENDFNLAWYTDAACTEDKKISKEDIAKSIPDSDTSYYLKVTFDAGEPSGVSTKNTNGHIAGGEDHIVEAANVDDNGKNYGIYEIKVIAGEIQIVKKLDEASSSEQVFEFEVTKKNDSAFTRTVSIVIPPNSTDQVFYTGEELKNLARGVYTVTEKSVNGYAVKDLSVADKTDCKNTLSNESATFTLGTNKKDVNVINKEWKYIGDGVLGVVTYTNEKVVSDWDIRKVSSSDNSLLISGAEFELKSSDHIYYGKSDEYGIVNWYETEDFSETSIASQLSPGTYTLKETKAPVGYANSSETWTIVITNNGDLKSIESSSGEVKKAESTDGKTTVHFYFENTAVFALPSTGGPGIFGYLIGGVLLMMAATLILYKNKHREVLEN